MGKPKFSRKRYEKPSHPWQADRIQAENELVQKYGLKNKREIWKAETALKRYRGQARELLAKIRVGDSQTKKESDQLLTRLTKLNILPANPTLDDVLALNTESILSRRLQTVTYLKGLASTPTQARQLISHGHIAINGRKVTVPSYMVTKEEEGNISYLVGSPMNDAMHPARPKPDFKSAQIKKEAAAEKPKEQKTEQPAEETQPEKIADKPDEIKEEKTVVEDKPEVKEGGKQDE